jgi:hypothetical protein
MSVGFLGQNARRARPHAEGHRSANGSTDAPPPRLRCDASRSMRAMSWSPHPSRRAYGHSTLRERLRMRAPQDEDSRARGSSLSRSRYFNLTMSNSPSRSRGAFFAPGACNFASRTRIEGWAERRETFGCLRGTRGAYHDAIRQALARRLASHNAGRSPLGAPPWRFWAPGAALPSPWAPAVLQRRAVAFGSVQRAPRTQVVVPGGRGPCLPRRAVTSRPPQDATPRSAFRIVSGDAPHERGCESCSIASI